MRRLPGETPASPRRICPFDKFLCAYPCNKLLHARMDAKLTDERVVEKLGVHRQTWWRYRGGQQLPPLSVCGYLAVLSGRLPWSGWEKFTLNVHHGKLFRSDLRDGFSPEDVAAIFWMRQELNFWRSLDQSRRESARGAKVIRFPSADTPEGQIA